MGKHRWGLTHSGARRIVDPESSIQQWWAERPHDRLVVVYRRYASVAEMGHPPRRACERPRKGDPRDGAADQERRASSRSGRGYQSAAPANV